MPEKEEINKWSATIEVGERIVDLLSGRIYRSLPIALKELVSNAWDADSDNVHIDIDFEKKSIIITDDGRGMTKENLEKYPSIAISTKTNGKSPGNRPYIGSFGVGIFSALAFCRRVIIQTTVENSNEINILKLETETWIDESGRRKAPSENKLDIEFPGHTSYDERGLKKQGTTITLEDIFPDDWAQLTVMNDMGHNGIEDLKNYLCQALPIEYPDNTYPYSEFFKPSTEYSSMNVFFNSEKLFRNNIRCSDGTSPRILDSNDNLVLASGSIVCKYIIVSPLKNVSPENMTGIQKRMKNVAIGEPELFDVFRKSPKLRGRMKYITGELHIIKGLENQLSLDRGTILACPEYTELCNFFRSKLIELAEMLENYGETEKLLGGLAYMEGIPIKKAKYGFLSDDSIRDSTKRKFSKIPREQLQSNLTKRLSKIGYRIRANPEELDNKIKVDHERKIITLMGKPGEGFINSDGIDIGDLEDANSIETKNGDVQEKSVVRENKTIPDHGAFFADIDVAGKLSSKKDEVDLLVVLKELHTMSTTKIKRKYIYELYPISAAMLMRSAYEQTLWLLMRRAKLMKDLQREIGKNKENIKLSELEDFLSKIKDTSPAITRDVRKRYASVERIMHREILNDIVHSPGKVKPTGTSIEDLCRSGLFHFIQEVLDYTKPEEPPQGS